VSFLVASLVVCHAVDSLVISLGLPLGCSGDAWLLGYCGVVIVCLLDWLNIWDCLVFWYFGLLLCTLSLLLASRHSHVRLVD